MGKKEKPAGGGPFKNKGFTFTLSIVLLSITLIAVAVFSREWRASQQVSFTEILPSEAQRIDERVASDMGKMFGAGAEMETKNQTTASVGTFTQAPFKKEGAPLAQIDDYSQSLSSSLRASGYEAVLATNNLGASNATVMVFFGNGSLEHSNDGPYDVSAYFHPTGANPSEIYATIICNKTASDVSPLSIIGGGQDGGGYYYRINYTELSSGKTYIVDCRSPSGSDTSLTISYPDLSQVFFDSSFSLSNSRNSTSVHYTKSPGGYLIVPFDSNQSGLNQPLRDYSLFENSLSLGNGTAGNAYSPTWTASGCKSGGCYQFDGASQYISGEGIGLFDSEIPAPLGMELISNGEFESFNSTLGIWFYWTKTIVGGVAFNATDDSATGSAVKISNDGSGGGSSLRQTAARLLGNTPYSLSFSSKGAGGRYRVVDSTNPSAEAYLHSDGTWGASAELPTNAGETYLQAMTQFSLPANSSRVRIELLPAATNGTVYYDSVSIKQATGQNGGFESWHYDTGFSPEAD